MDQFIALLGRPDHALYLDCRPTDTGTYAVAQVPLPEDYKVLIANTGVRHTNVGGEFNARVAACRAGVACLRAKYPGITHLRDVQEVTWEALENLLPETMMETEARKLGADFENLPHLRPGSELQVRACCRHVHSENARVHATREALEAGDTSLVGKLLNEAHTSARDDYDISCPELEAMVASALSVDGVVGARLTGAGWGGCVVALVHEDAVTTFTEQVARDYRDRTGLEAAIFACRASGGAGLVGTFDI
jgi:galactokinase